VSSYFMFVNACRTQIAVPGITASATEIPVVNVDFFPAEIPEGKRLALTLHHEGVPGNQEIVYCTAITGNVLTVIRGREGTTAQSWIAGSVVGAYLTADILDTVANQDEMAAETLARILLIAEQADAVSLPAESAQESAQIAADAAAEATASAELAAQAEADANVIILDAAAVAQVRADAEADAARADEAADEAEASAAQALQSAIDASGLGFQTATGTLLQDTDTITLPWPCDTTRKNVAVYLGRSKEPQPSLTFVDETHIKVGGPVPQDTPYEVLSLVMSSATILDDFYNGAQAAAVAAEAAEDGAQVAQAAAESAQTGAQLAQAGAEAARDSAVSAAADRDIENWNESTAYVATSLVTGSDGHKYICICGHTGVDPVGDNDSYWVDLSVLGLELGETETTAYPGDKGQYAYDHAVSGHAPVNAQKNSDITKEEIESKLTGNISTHAHYYAMASTPGGPASSSAECTGNAATATKLQTPRSISLAGVLSGSANFDGSANITISAQAVGIEPAQVAGNAIYSKYDSENGYSGNSYATTPGRGELATFFEAGSGHVSIRVEFTGMVKAYFEARELVSAGSTYARILKNGVQLQEWTITTQTYVALSVNTTVKPGDIISFQARSDNFMYRPRTRNHRILVG